MNYARIVDEKVVEIIPSVVDEEGQQVSIELRFHPDFVATLVEIPSNASVKEGDSYINKKFGPPKDPVLSPAEMLDAQNTKLSQLTQLAVSQKYNLIQRISVISDAIELGEATKEEENELLEREDQLVLWKKFAVYLGRVTSQSGWPNSVEWPIQPEEGI